MRRFDVFVIGGGGTGSEIAFRLGREGSLHIGLAERDKLGSRGLDPKNLTLKRPGTYTNRPQQPERPTQPLKCKTEIGEPNNPSWETMSTGCGVSSSLSVLPGRRDPEFNSC